MIHRLPPDERRRRRREALVIAVTALVVVTFAVFETRLPRLSDSSSPSGNVTFFLLINLNLVLLVLLIFLVARNFAKLVLDRRRRILGSRLRTRLVLAFVSLTLVPSVLLFLFAQSFLTAVIENWFSGRVEGSMNASRRIAEAYYQNTGSNALHFARSLAEQISARDLLVRTAEQPLRDFVAARRAELNLDGVEVVVGQETVARASSVLGRDARNSPVTTNTDLRDALIEGREFLRTQPEGDGDVVRAGVPIRARTGDLLGAVVVSYRVPRALGDSALEAVRAHEEYRSLRILEQPIKNGYIISFLLITLLVIFSATWFGFYLAKGITVPIQRLGEGMREVAHGNWEYRAEAGGDEEVATLVDSFNRMTAELQSIHSALEERHRYIENVLANVAAGVLSIDSTGLVATVNTAAAAMLGLKAGEVRGCPWQEVFDAPHLQKVREIILRIQEATGEKVERQIKLSGGSRSLTAWVTATVLTDDDGAARGMILFFEDVTHLLRAERMEAWREVARRIAHEIKNPLTPIQLSAQRLRKRYGAVLGESERALLDECTRTIVGQVDALRRLVDEFSTFARLPALEVAPHDLNAVVEDALVLFREGHPQIGFDFAPDLALPAVDIDREAIKRAVINMLDNAVAACGHEAASGQVQVRTAYLPRSGVVRLEVADNGCGMSSDVKARAFEPYFSTKKDGTGLGLAIVSAVAADHQAYVRVYDNVPQGTRLVIEFPLRRPAVSRAAAQA